MVEPDELIMPALFGETVLPPPVSFVFAHHGFDSLRRRFSSRLSRFHSASESPAAMVLTANLSALNAAKATCTSCGSDGAAGACPPNRVRELSHTVPVA